MNKTVLIQRLCEPSKANVEASSAVSINPFSFGAGGGRFSKMALDLLLPICSFDYMGASEFEHGAVPGAFGTLHELGHSTGLFFNTLSIKLKDCKKPEFASRRDVARTWESCPVYVIGSKSDQAEIERRIRIIATDESLACHGKGRQRTYDEGLRVRESVQLQKYIQYVPTYKGAVGWIELDNGFLFTVDEAMAAKFKAMLMP